MDVSDSATPTQRPGLTAWALLVPLLGWLLVFVVVPTGIMLVFSFCQRQPLGEIVYQFTTDNYRRVADAHQAAGLLWAAGAAVFVAVAWRLVFGVTSMAAWLSVFWVVLNVTVLRDTAASATAKWLKIFVISVNYAAASTAICVAAGYPVAYFIGRAADRWRTLLIMLVMVPFWTSFLVRTYAWVTILRSEGVLSSLLQWLHLIDGPIDWLYPSQTGVMIGLVYTYLPFMILPIYTSVERLDGALIEAALDLGASPLRVFTRVILPLTRPGITAGIVLTFVPAIGMFAVNDILGGRQEMLIGNVIERQFTAARDKPFGAALGVLLIGLFLATYAMSLRRDSEPTKTSEPATR